MPLRALLLGIVVTLLWGLNFSVIALAQDVFDPLLLATLRFVLTCVPVIFFVPRPRVAFRYLLAYGMVFGVLQFALLFGGIFAGLSPGLASVVLQSQVFFTILFGVGLLGERVRGFQVFGIVLGFGGVALTATVTDGSVTILGLLLVAGAGLSWGLANVIVKKVKPDNAVGFMVWSSTVPILPLAGATLLLEGPASVAESFRTVTWSAALSVLYLVYVTTLFGYAVWNTLLRQYPTAVVAPLTLLVPFFGIAGSMVIFGEALTPLKVAAAGLMIVGLGVNQFGQRALDTYRRGRDRRRGGGAEPAAAGTATLQEGGP